MLVTPLPGFGLERPLSPAERREQREHESSKRIAEIKSALESGSCEFLRVSHLGGLETDEHFSVLVRDLLALSKIKVFIAEHISKFPCLDGLEIKIMSVIEIAEMSKWMKASPTEREEIITRYLERNPFFTFSKKRVTPDSAQSFGERVKSPLITGNNDWYFVRSYLEHEVMSLLREFGEARAQTGESPKTNSLRPSFRRMIGGFLSGGRHYQDPACAAAGDDTLFS